MSTLSNSRPIMAVSVWLCAAFSVGCPAAQVRPMPGDCPREAVQSMEKMNLFTGGGNGKGVRVVLDINQPGEYADGKEGSYRPGPLVSKVVDSRVFPSLPDGTLLYGELWTEGLAIMRQEAVMARFTEALLPDGQRVPVCLVLYTDGSGLLPKEPGSKPGEAHLYRVQHLQAVYYWP